jgi:hypothetical protein
MFCIIGFFIISIVPESKKPLGGMIYAIGFLLVALGLMVQSDYWADRATDWWRGGYPKLKLVQFLVQFVVRRYPWVTDYVLMRRFYKRASIGFVIAAICFLVFVVIRILLPKS